ncbi:hypothetical protein EJ08DRAFT_580400 [Tothia fuscella]|uniref:Uncharacterized protein n=1 Tax=Tothia fuscella TaxID=1048955 RepID=A0A9P4NZT8_9PEZI|nr:hypothetical protein EJ08DRAFT_580400 [Tothia fuscella]
MESPFYTMRSDDLSAICASAGFQVLRHYLAKDGGQSSFCHEHGSTNPVVQSIWVLHRDILHGMTMPVVQLFTQASALAYAALSTKNKHDLELAFRGEARSAFSWLQCFVEEEEDWCYTKGCPACATLNILSTESTIRATLAAAQLSVPRGSNPAECYINPDDRSLPHFLATIPALQSALTNDPFWGPGVYEHMLNRSSRLATGIHELISQCSALEALVTSAPSSPTGGLDIDLRQGPTLREIFAEQNAEIRVGEDASSTRVGKEMQLKKSRMAKRQMRLREEQKAMVARMAWQCFSVVQLPAQQRMALRAAGRKNVILRRRSLTSP